ncbi:MAG: ABC transporter permease subunit [Pirellulales bacterium]
MSSASESANSANQPVGDAVRSESQRSESQRSESQRNEPQRHAPRRTLESGFSILARGESRIWLTGGMLVICLAMIAGLLTLIVLNGLATFWPGRVDWLLLNDGTMNVGELQRTIDEDRDGRADKVYYRTANFDISNEHYTWFESSKLEAENVVQPQWALVIERMSYGRLLGLPARMSVMLDHYEAADADDAVENAYSDTAALNEVMTQFSAEFEQLQLDPPVNADEVSKLLATVAVAAAEQKSKLLKSRIAALAKGDVDHVETKSGESDAWNAGSGSSDALLQAARLRWDQPQEILDAFARISGGLASRRSLIKQQMHEISRLDRELSDARVQVRQAELDTGARVVERIDEVGALVQELVTVQSQIAAADSAAETAKKWAVGDAGTRLHAIWKAYRQQKLATVESEVKSRLEAWRKQFEAEPEQVKRSIEVFENAWLSVLQKKLPLEKSINDLRARSTGMEMLVSVPNNAVPIEMSEDDIRSALSGKWTETAKSLLIQQGLTVVSDPILESFTADCKQIVFETAERGRVSQWVFTVPKPKDESASGGDAPSSATDAPKQTQVQQRSTLAAVHALNCDEIVRIVPANRLGIGGKLAVYGSRWAEFLIEDPREANSEGGVFPAIWGTVVMTLIMTLAVVPFGVIAALYLREYTRSGPLVSLVRISINNLAGVPSIVYGVFGLAFFCYTIGAFVDGGPKNADIEALPSGTWYTVFAATVVCGTVAFLVSFLSSGPAHLRTPAARVCARVAPWVWLVSLGLTAILILKSPFFSGFYEARLPAPTFGKEGLLWASMTLALLTLPVVIVATEEALAAVPNSLREGSLACGASKWQTIYRIVLPHARPGILTGAILAMARGIGEVAPLMLVGALPVAPDLPLDSEFPYFHGSRSFMHLGYQIFWLGFQSQNSEASKPMVFTCTLLLILIVAALNLSAILLRARLRRQFQGSQF